MQRKINFRLKKITILHTKITVMFLLLVNQEVMIPQSNIKEFTSTRKILIYNLPREFTYLNYILVQPNCIIFYR